jgi:hypothetical protein
MYVFLTFAIIIVVGAGTLITWLVYDYITSSDTVIYLKNRGQIKHIVPGAMFADRKHGANPFLHNQDYINVLEVKDGFVKYSKRGGVYNYYNGGSCSIREFVVRYVFVRMEDDQS